MNKNILLTITYLSILAWPFQSILTAQYGPANCKQFQKLLGHNDLHLSTRVDEEYLFTAEMIQPVIIVKNTSSTILEVPTIDKTSGAVVGASVSGLKARGHLPIVEVCSIPTEKLLPGQERHFAIEHDSGNLFDRGGGMRRTYLPVADNKPGRAGYIIDLANISISGGYKIVQPAIRDFGCVSKKGSIPQASRNPKETPADPCIIVAILEHDGDYFFMAGASSVDVSTFGTILVYAERSSPDDRSVFLAEQAPVRILKLDGAAQFSRSWSKAPIPEAEFKVVPETGTAISLDQLEGKWEARRRELGRR